MKWIPIGHKDTSREIVHPCNPLAIVTGHKCFPPECTYTIQGPFPLQFSQPHKALKGWNKSRNKTPSWGVFSLLFQSDGHQGSHFIPFSLPLDVLVLHEGASIVLKSLYRILRVSEAEGQRIVTASWWPNLMMTHSKPLRWDVGGFCDSVKEKTWAFTKNLYVYMPLYLMSLVARVSPVMSPGYPYWGNPVWRIWGTPYVQQAILWQSSN